MVTHYVDSNATGAANGTSFADAFASIDDVTTHVAGDRILVASDHSENLTGNLVQTPSSYTPSPKEPIVLMSVNSSTEVFEAGASFTLNQSRRFQINTRWIGFDISMGNGDVVFPINAGSLPVYFFECTFTKTSNGNAFNFGNAQFQFHFCEFTFNNSNNSPFSLANSSVVHFYYCTADGTTSQNLFSLTGTQPPSTLVIEGCDFSAMASLPTPLISVGAQILHGRITDTRLPTGVDVFDRTQGDIDWITDFLITKTGDGSFTDPDISLAHENFYGTVTSDTVRTRTGGASDGVTDFSWRMAFDSGAVHAPEFDGIQSPPISVYLESGASRTVTVNIAHDGIGDGTSGALTDREIWIEGIRPDAANPSFPGESFTTKGSGSDLSTNSETWSGSGVGTTQEISFTYTPNVSGLLTFRVNFAPVDATGVAVSLDPKPEVT